MWDPTDGQDWLNLLAAAGVVAVTGGLALLFLRMALAAAGVWPLRRDR